MKKSTMTPEHLAAFLHCMGVHLGLSAANCRNHVMTDALDGPDHPGLDHICGEPTDHPNRHRCARDGCAFEWVQSKEER